MKYFVYVLIDEQQKQYVGYTSNLERRLKEHQSGQTQTTSRMKNVKIAYMEEVDSLEEALYRERYLKTAAGRRFRKKIILPR